MNCSNTRHEMVLKVRMGARRDGTIEAIDLYALSNAGAYGYHGTTTVTLVGRQGAADLQTTPRRAALATTWSTPTPRRAAPTAATARRRAALPWSPPSTRWQTSWAWTRASCASRTWSSPARTLWQLNDEHLYSCRLDECLGRAMEMVGWKDRPLREDLGDRVRGLGVALTMQGSGIAMVDIANVDIRLEDDGFYVLSIGATDVGTGADTILAQMAAEALGCDVDRIVTKGVDTDTSPFDTGAYASLRHLHHRRRRRARGRGPHPPDSRAGGPRLRRGRPGRGVRRRVRALRRAGDDPSPRWPTSSSALACTPACSRATAPTPSPPRRRPTWPASPRWRSNKATGKVTVTDYAAVVDCGTVINPALARVQAEGGIAQGIGMALTEDVLARRAREPPHRQPHDLQAAHPHGRARAARGVHAELRAHGPLRRQGPSARSSSTRPPPRS